jgi:hypothetical protein
MTLTMTPGARCSVVFPYKGEHTTEQHLDAVARQCCSPVSTTEQASEQMAGPGRPCGVVVR